jgi:HAE1 family hydrophobic/amphiphilic exporter-1
VLRKAEEILKQQPEIENIFAVGGFSFSGSTPNNGLIFSTLKPWEERSQADQSVKSIIGGFFPKPSGTVSQNARH